MRGAWEGWEGGKRDTRCVLPRTWVQAVAAADDQKPTKQLAQLAWYGGAVNKAPLNVPPWHWTHTDDAEPAAHPEAQVAQGTSALGENLPWPHGTHVVAPPTVVATVPGRHVAHAVTELEPAGDDWPAPHDVHEESPALE